MRRRKRKETREEKGGVRVLIDKRRGIVDFVVDDQVEVFFGVVGGDFGEGEFFGHFDDVFFGGWWCRVGSGSSRVWWKMTDGEMRREERERERERERDRLD